MHWNRPSSSLCFNNLPASRAPLQLSVDRTASAQMLLDHDVLPVLLPHPQHSRRAEAGGQAAADLHSIGKRHIKSPAGCSAPVFHRQE